MKKPSAVSGKGKAASADRCPDAGLAKDCPILVEYLVTVRWEDGSVREKSALTIFVEDGKMKAALNDKDLRRSLYVSADTVEGLLGTLEKALGGDTPDWRAWKGGKR